ncbi:MAG: hypothetical protein O2798_01860 [Chloroflexi bacterium]|nr:hypothetical protein [Chloroflexota bacterium]MDA1239566.1 hypothetical protein [Chloroflexota bacterium]
MRVLVIPHQRRPGIGRAPIPDGHRATLPEQARLCPVLEDGSRLGYLVYPPLAATETMEVRLLTDGVFRLTLLVQTDGATAQPVAVMEIRPTAGTGGIEVREVLFVEPKLGFGEPAIRELFDMLVTNVNAPDGGIGLRGAHDFVTPEGWDTVYSGVLNETSRPHLPVLTARIETDWYAQPTEFRYILQSGEALSVRGHAPIGQVFFVPRETVTLDEGSEEDQAAFADRLRAYWAERTAKERAMPYGSIMSHHYRDIQRGRPLTN